MNRISYQARFVGAWVCLIVGLILGAIKLSDATTLGLSVQASAWLAVVGMVITGLQAVLPRITATPTDARKNLD